MDNQGAFRRSLDALATVFLALETATVGGTAAVYVSYALLDDRSATFAWGGAVVAALLAIGLAFVTWGFARRRRFALGGAFTWQLLQVSTGVWAWGVLPAAGAALVVTGIVVAAAVMLRIASLPAREAA